MTTLHRLLLSVSLAAAAAACNNAGFAGDADSKKNGPVVPAESTTPEKPEPPKEPLDKPTVTPTEEVPETGQSTDEAVPDTDAPPECRNEVMTVGVRDPASGKTFKLMPDRLGYDEALAACKATAASGALVYAKQELPDAILACRLALGTLWLRKDASALWQPEVLGESDKSEKHWVICYY